MSIRGTMEIKRAHTLPCWVPGTGMRGENAKDSTPGTMVFFTRLVRPNTAPRKAPCRGPSTMAPMMTGTWRMVALMRGRSMSPMGVAAMSRTMAVNRASTTISLTAALRAVRLGAACIRTFNCKTSCCRSPPGEIQRKFCCARGSSVLSCRPMSGTADRFGPRRFPL